MIFSKQVWRTKLQPAIQILLILVVALFSQLYKLGDMPYRLWDEARLAHNAYEMAHSSNIIVTTMHGQPDTWNSKPPLMIWAQAICIKVNGLNEISTRLPAALSAILCIVMIAAFVYHITKSGWTALLAAFVLSSSIGYIGYHGTRYGEFDSMLALFTTAYLLAYFLYLENEGPKANRYLLAFFVCLSLAVLTKSVAGLLFTPALFVYTIVRGKLAATLINKKFYFGALLFIGLIGTYYLLREHYNPGYLKAVYENELGGRYMKVNEEHTGPWTYYWAFIKWSGFGTWFWALPVSILVFILSSKGVFKRAISFLWLASFVFLVVISSSATKLEWYCLPVFPLLAIVASLTVLGIARLLAAFVNLNVQTLVILLAAIFSLQPAKELYLHLKYIGDDLSSDKHYALSYYLRDALHGKRDLKEATFLYYGYYSEHSLYILALNDKGQNIKQAYNTGDVHFTAGQKVFVIDDASEQYIEKNYKTELLEEFYGVKLFVIGNTN
ncbi:MAG: glycosyltransferase family 39 protein [Bacteroidetes bacterium]|nr:glycosyltransferase family 39 protein [Bacteroidota bacterium]